MEKGILNINDIFFIKSLNIRNCGLNEKFDSVCGREDFSVIDRQYNGNEIFNANNHGEVLFAVKYIGNGIFQELITGEKISIGGRTIAVESPNNISASYFLDVQDCPFSDWTPLKYEDYLHDGDHKSNIVSENDYSVLVEKDLNFALTYPLSISEVMIINDETKKEYIKHNDTERQQLITKFKEIAKKDAEELKNSVMPVLENMKKGIYTNYVDTKSIELTDQELELAYLENQLYDFKKNERTK